MSGVDITRFPKTKIDLEGEGARQIPFVNFKKIFSQNTPPLLELRKNI